MYSKNLQELYYKIKSIKDEKESERNKLDNQIEVLDETLYDIAGALEKEGIIFVPEHFKEVEEHN